MRWHACRLFLRILRVFRSQFTGEWPLVILRHKKKSDNRQEKWVQNCYFSFEMLGKLIGTSKSSFKEITYHPMKINLLHAFRLWRWRTEKNKEEGEKGFFLHLPLFRFCLSLFRAILHYLNAWNRLWKDKLTVSYCTLIIISKTAWRSELKNYFSRKRENT